MDEPQARDAVYPQILDSLLLRTQVPIAHPPELHEMQIPRSILVSSLTQCDQSFSKSNLKTEQGFRGAPSLSEWRESHEVRSPSSSPTIQK